MNFLHAGFIVTFACCEGFLNDSVLTWLRKEFEDADADNSGLIDEFEVVKLMKKLNKGIATVKIQQKMKVLYTMVFMSYR